MQNRHSPVIWRPSSVSSHPKPFRRSSASWTDSLPRPLTPSSRRPSREAAARRWHSRLTVRTPTLLPLSGARMLAAVAAAIPTSITAWARRRRQGRQQANELCPQRAKRRAYQQHRRERLCGIGWPLARAMLSRRSPSSHRFIAGDSLRARLHRSTVSAAPFGRVQLRTALPLLTVQTWRLRCAIGRTSWRFFARLASADEEHERRFHG